MKFSRQLQIIKHWYLITVYCQGNRTFVLILCELYIKCSSVDVNGDFVHRSHFKPIVQYWLLLQVSDQLVEINGKSTAGMSHSQSVEQIRTAGHKIHLVLKKGNGYVPDYGKFHAKCLLQTWATSLFKRFIHHRESIACFEGCFELSMWWMWEDDTGRQSWT